MYLAQFLLILRPQNDNFLSNEQFFVSDPGVFYYIHEIVANEFATRVKSQAFHSLLNISVHLLLTSNLPLNFILFHPPWTLVPVSLPKWGHHSLLGFSLFCIVVQKLPEERSCSDCRVDFLFLFSRADPWTACCLGSENHCFVLFYALL